MIFEKYKYWISTIAISFIGIIYILRVDHVIGQFVDDAWYLVLAKSIAENGTYQLISSPIQGIQPIYPPGFPLILAGVLKLVPVLATHLWALKYVSVLAMTGVGVTSYKYYSKICKFPNYVSFFCTLLVVLSPAFVFIATSTLMTECVFTCFLLLSLTRIEINCEKDVILNRILLEVGLLVSFAFLLRSAALLIIIAILARFIFLKKYRTVVKLIGVICICILPWVIYSRVSYPNNLQTGLHGGSIVMSYFDALRMKVAGVEGSELAKPEDYLKRVNENIRSIFERDMIGMFLPSVVRGTEESGAEVMGLGGAMKMGLDTFPFARETKYFSLFFFAFVFIGILLQCKTRISSIEISLVLTFLMTIIWPWLTFRFMLPFFPFLVGYLVISLQKLPQLIQQITKMRIDEYLIVRGVLICLLFFVFIEHVNYIIIKQKNPQMIGWIDDYDAVVSLADRINKNLPVGSLIASTNPAQLYLLTGHPGISAGLKDEAWKYWRQSGLRYLANTRPVMFVPSRTGDAANIIYKVPTMSNLMIIDLGDYKTLASNNSIDVRNSQK